MSECRLSISRAVKNSLLPRLDESDFMALGVSHCDRSELYLFALSLGAISKRTAREATSISLVRPATLKQAWTNYLFIVYLASLKSIEKEVHTIGDDESTVAYCNKVANAGFAEIETLMKDPADRVIEDMTADLNESYERFRKKFEDLDLPPLE